MLVAAGQHLGAKQREPADACPTVVADSRVENVNSAVDATLASAKLRRVLVQVEVTYSNSIIEAWWRSLDGMNRRGSVRRLDELEPMLGTATAPARVAFEASREAWHVHDVMVGWEKEPVLLDTTRTRRIGVGQHGRKNDSIDAEAIALAMDAGRVPVAHVLSPERRILRAKLSVRGELVETRARQVTLLRGLARAAGVLISSSSTDNFLQKLQEAPLNEATRALMAPLVPRATRIGS